MNQPLPTLQLGQIATVLDFHSKIAPQTKQRLQDLGIHKDRTITLLRRSPFGGPISIAVGSLVLALDIELASDILVQPQ